MNKRGAYFFVIDALIAASIITMSLIIIFTSHNLRPDTNPTLRLVEDYSDFLITTKVREFQGAYVQSLIDNGNITDRDNSLLQQLTEFYFYNKTRNNTQIMWNFTEEISHGLVPQQRSVMLLINDTLIYTRQLTLPNQSNLMLSTKKLSFKKINDSYIYGPVVVEVMIWI